MFQNYSKILKKWFLTTDSRGVDPEQKIFVNVSS